jgi:hypothetical protein
MRDTTAVVDWARLTDLDLERLVADLFGREWSTHVETFRRGPDEGIDIRATGPISKIRLLAGEVVIGQVKHYPSATPSRVRSAFEADVKKPGIKQATRYLAVTTAPLSPKAKDQIASLHDKIAGPGDVYGASDLESLLRRHPEVELDYLPLWIQHPLILRDQLNGKQLKLQDMVLRRLRQQTRLLVPTRQLDIARALMLEEGAVIVAGPPGCGKTSIANQLVAEGLRDGFQVLVASASLSDVYSMLRGPGRKMLFYDDFLGSSLRTAFLHEKNEDQRLLDLLVEARENEDLRLVLTTREYILSAARSKHERLNDARIDVDRIILEPLGLSAEERARIIERHVYHSRYCRAILSSSQAPDVWAPVLRHQQFSPRLVEFFINAADRDVESGGVPPSARSFVRSLDAALSDPSDLWVHAYDNQLNHYQREIIQTLATLPYPTVAEDIFELTEGRFREVVGRPFSNSKARVALRAIIGDFVDSRPTHREPILSPANPSIASYAWFRIADDSATLLSTLRHAMLFEQVEVIAKLFGFLPSPGDTSSLELSSAEAVPWVARQDFDSREVAEVRLGIEAALIRTFTQGLFTAHPSIAGDRRHWLRLRAPIASRSCKVLELCARGLINPSQELMATVVGELVDSINRLEGDPNDVLEALSLLNQLNGDFRWRLDFSNLETSCSEYFLGSVSDPAEAVWAVSYLHLSGRSDEVGSFRSAMLRWVDDFEFEPDELGGPAVIELHRLQTLVDSLSDLEQFQILKSWELSELRQTIDRRIAKLDDAIDLEARNRSNQRSSGSTRRAPARVAAVSVSLSEAIDAGRLLTRNDSSSW